MSAPARPVLASLAHGPRYVVPDTVPIGSALNVAALAAGWCELTTAVVPLMLFDEVRVISRHRVILPTTLQPWFRGCETGNVLCLASTREDGANDVLLVDVNHLVSTLAAGRVMLPHTHRWTTAPSRWLSTLRQDRDRRPPTGATGFAGIERGGSPRGAD